MKKLSVALVFGCALVFRLWLIPFAWHVDMFSNAAWGEWIFVHGTKGFYEWNVWTYSWPTQPPLITSIYGFNKKLYITLLGNSARVQHIVDKYHVLGGHWDWLDRFVEWFAYGRINIYLPFQAGYLVTMKLLPIAADLVIAGIIVGISRKIKWGVVYLFIPFSWYLSSLWGQYDQVGFLALLLGFSAIPAAPILSPVVFAISVLIKPTGLVFAPLLGWWYWRSRKWKQLTVGVLVAVGIAYWTTVGYAYRPVWDFWRYDLVTKIFYKSEFRVSTNSFNFWHIFIDNKALNQNTSFGFLPAKVWGWGVFAALLGAVVIKYKTVSIRNIFESMFVVGAGGWMFLTNMLERYYFAGVVSGLIVCAWRPRLFKWWLVMAIIFSINLYHGWWFPDSNGVIESVFEWQSGMLSRLLAAVNLGIYLFMLRYLLKKNEKQLA